MRKTVLGWAYTDKPKTTTASSTVSSSTEKKFSWNKKTPGKTDDKT